MTNSGNGSSMMDQLTKKVGMCAPDYLKAKGIEDENPVNLNGTAMGQLYRATMAIADDYKKTTDGNKAAGTRVRATMLTIKKLTLQVRKECLTLEHNKLAARRVRKEMLEVKELCQGIRTECLQLRKTAG